MGMLLLMAASGAAVANPDLCRLTPTDVRIDKDSPIVAELSTVSTVKDQFETEAEFQARARRELGTKLPQLQDAVVALVAPVDRSIQYSAETQILTIPSIGHERYAMSSIRPISGGKGYHGAYIYREDMAPSSYVGQNAYGASAFINVTNRLAVGIAWDPKVFKMANNGSLGLPKKIVSKALPNEARQMSNDARYVVRGKLIPPYVFKEEMTYGSPTFSQPFETREVTTWFFMEPIAVCLVAGEKVLNQWEIQRK